MTFSQAIAPADFPKKRVDPDSKNPEVAYSDAPHVGLMWTRYHLAHVCLDDDCRDWSSLSLPGDSPVDRKKVLDVWSGFGALSCFVRSVNRLQPQPSLKELRKRRDATHRGLGIVHVVESKLQWRAAVGLGNATTFENSGITLHATYGFPILPASSLKGVARHYLWEDPALLSADDPVREKATRIEQRHGQTLADVLFGKRDTDDLDHLAAIRLHDAWPRQRPPKGWFDVDVLTVHHKRYYEDKLDYAEDSENPVPVHFLTLQPDTEFSIPLGLTAFGKLPRHAPHDDYLEVAKTVLKLALLHGGIGGKTASGYGRLSSKE